MIRHCVPLRASPFQFIKQVCPVSDHNPNPTPRRFTKLIVEDIERASEFYQAVCGLVQDGEGADRIAGRPIREIYFKREPTGNGSFTLTKFLDAPRERSQAMILGFVTEDIEAFMQGAIAAGAEVVEAIAIRPEHGVKVAFVNDLEGNLIEVVELI